MLSGFELILLTDMEITISFDEAEHFVAKIASHLHDTFTHFITYFKLRTHIIIHQYLNNKPFKYCYCPFGTICTHSLKQDVNSELTLSVE